MSKVSELIDSLRGRTDLVVQEERAAWRILVPRSHGHLCSITVPHECFEWFVDVQADGRALWSDWMEHYGSPPAQLDAERATCLAAFLERATDLDLELPSKIHAE